MSSEDIKTGVSDNTAEDTNKTKDSTDNNVNSQGEEAALQYAQGLYFVQK